MPETLFNIARYLLHMLVKDIPSGVSRVYPLCIIFINIFVQSQRHKAIKETLSPSLQIALTLRLHVTQSGHARFDLLSQSTA